MSDGEFENTARAKPASAFSPLLFWNSFSDCAQSRGEFVSPAAIPVGCAICSHSFIGGWCRNRCHEACHFFGHLPRCLYLWGISLVCDTQIHKSHRLSQRSKGISPSIRPQPTSTRTHRNTTDIFNFPTARKTNIRRKFQCPHFAGTKNIRR